jgi:SAM-dependent methyltransferase
MARAAIVTFYGDDLARIHDAGFGFWARGATGGVLRILSDAGIESGLVVDLGCGSGIAASLLADAGYKVLGIDVSEAMVSLARERVPRARFVCGSLHDVELPPRCAAVVAMGEILSYAGVSDDLFTRVQEALEPGGLFMFDVATPGRGSQRTWHSGDGWVVCSSAVESAGPPRLTREVVSFRRASAEGWTRSDEVHELSLYSPAELVAALSRAGFADARVLAEGYGPELELPEGIAVLRTRAP